MVPRIDHFVKHEVIDAAGTRAMVKAVPGEDGSFGSQDVFNDKRLSVSASRVRTLRGAALA